MTTPQVPPPKLRFATVWLAGCSGCHMSFLDLDEWLFELAAAVEIVYSPVASDIKVFPEGGDLCLVEGAVANADNLELALKLRARSRGANLAQRLRPPRRSRFFSEYPTASYGESFQLEQLGPPAMLERLARPRWRGAQRRIGLTGGIASGKSSVGGLLAARGLPVLDADRYARDALAPGQPATRAVLARYGSKVQGEGEEALDRAALGRIVFADEKERRWLEALVHPLVRQRYERELAALADAPTVVLMVPLLFEAELEALCSEVWLVDCGEDQQLQRLMVRDGLGEEEARRRLAAQWPLARKRGLADVVIDNRGSPAQLSERLWERVAGRLRAQGSGTT